LAGDFLCASHYGRRCPFGDSFRGMSNGFAECFGGSYRMSFFYVVSGGFGSVADIAGRGSHSFASAHIQMRQRALVELAADGELLVLLIFPDRCPGLRAELAIRRTGIVAVCVQLVLSRLHYIGSDPDHLDIELNFSAAVSVF